jgi:hypothetical protein
VSHTHVPSILFCPVGHPDWGGTGIEIGDGISTVETDDGDGEESQQQHPQQLSSPHAASA